MSHSNARKYLEIFTPFWPWFSKFKNSKGLHIFQYETRKEGEVVLEGSNASAEEADEGCDESAVSGIDIVLNHRLVETGFGDKKGFTDYLKTYMKKVLKHLEENDRKAEIEEFKANINKVMKELMGRWKDLQFFTGKSF